jgi:hypothetical protein
MCQKDSDSAVHSDESWRLILIQAVQNADIEMLPWRKNGKFCSKVYVSLDSRLPSKETPAPKRRRIEHRPADSMDSQLSLVDDRFLHSEFPFMPNRFPSLLMAARTEFLNCPVMRDENVRRRVLRVLEQVEMSNRVHRAFLTLGFLVLLKSPIQCGSRDTGKHKPMRWINNPQNPTGKLRWFGMFIYTALSMKYRQTIGMAQEGEANDAAVGSSVQGNHLQ